MTERIWRCTRCNTLKLATSRPQKCHACETDHRGSDGDHKSGLFERAFRGVRG